jgi:hypothetical protein
MQQVTNLAQDLNLHDTDMTTSTQHALLEAVATGARYSTVCTARHITAKTFINKSQLCTQSPEQGCAQAAVLWKVRLSMDAQESLCPL